MKALLLDLLRVRLSPQAWAWLETALEGAAPPVKKNRLLGSFGAASGKLGRRALLLDDAEKERLQRLAPSLPLDHWGVDEAARAVLLLSLSHLSPADYAGLILECYRCGDTREQQSWLRALSLLPDCEQFLETAVDACRTNIIPLFEAIACENPYPARCFPELNFNQMVLKSLFNSIALARIAGLEKCFNSELSRMADDYVTEREAAGRGVPADIWFVLAPHIRREGLARVYRYLHHEDPGHRYWAAAGLGFRRDAASRLELEGQAKIESEPGVQAAIEVSLTRMAGID